MSEPEATSSPSTSPVLETDPLKCSMDSLIVSDSSDDVFGERASSGSSTGSNPVSEQPGRPQAKPKKKRTRERKISISRDRKLMVVLYNSHGTPLDGSHGPVVLVCL